MNRILIHHEVFIAAHQGDLRAKSALAHAKRENRLLPWAMGDVVQRLAQAGAAAAEVKELIKGISLIPLDAGLSLAALERGRDFDFGLYEKAGTQYHCNLLLSLKGEGLAPMQGLTPAGLLEWQEPAPSKVEFLNLKHPVHAVFNQVSTWQAEIVQNTAFAGGNHVNELEKEWAAYCGTSHAVGVGSGTEALLFPMLALGVGPGDEVIVPANTFIATSEAVSQAGATPVFCDVTPGSWTMDPASAASKITSKTKMLLPVHLYGQPADMNALSALAKQHNLLLLEDACQAHGAYYHGKRAGNLGVAAAFSMYPGKNLGAYGEAGMITTNDADLAKKMRMIREHGQAEKYYHDMEGYNGRMDNLQAAALRGKLPHLDAWNNERRQIAQWYLQGLQGVSPITLPSANAGADSVWHLFVIVVPDNHALHEALKKQNIFTGFHYPVPLHLQKAYAHRGYKKGDFPHSERNGGQGISLPMYPELGKAEVDLVIKAIKAFYA